MLVDDVKALMREIGNVSISFIKQSGNQCAHTLAEAVVSVSGSNEWEYLVHHYKGCTYL